MKSLFIAVATVILTGCSSIATSLDVGSAKARIGETGDLSGRPPLGFSIMCLKYPRECDGGGKASISATHGTLATLRTINVNVNHSIVPQSDGRRDVWSVGATYGDCEEYVLAKRRALIAANIDASSLRIAFVKTRLGRDHAVLIVKSNQGDFVLDNLTDSIMPLSHTQYRLVAISGASPARWSS